MKKIFLTAFLILLTSCFNSASPNRLTAVAIGRAGSGSCANGGQVIKIGYDTNGNGILDPNEVLSEQAVCNGTNGQSGHNSLALVEDETAGANCGNGGKKISVGIDTNDDNILQSSEATSTQYVCNGYAGGTGPQGHNSLIATTPEPPGNNCGFGGQAISSGIDSNDNSTLDSGEIATTSYACSATCGTYTCGGQCGTCSPTVADTCSNGGCMCGQGAACSGNQTCRSGQCKDPPNVACASSNTATGINVGWDFQLAHVSSNSFFDLLTVGGPTVDYYVGSSNGTFTQNSSLVLGGMGAYGANFADVDHDGVMDILTAGPNGSQDSKNGVSLRTNGTFDPLVTLWTSNSIAFYGVKVLRADLNEDGTDDGIWVSSDKLVVGLSPYSRTDSKFVNPPTQLSYANPGNVYKAMVADLDGNGHQDVIVALGVYSTTWDGEIAIFTNDGAGNLTRTDLNTPTVSLFTGDHLNPFSVAVGDFNGDGKLDIAWPNYSSGHTGIIIGLRTSANGAAPAYNFSQLHFNGWDNDDRFGLVAADFDNDGKVDLVASPWGDARLLQGAGDGTFTLNGCSLGLMQSPIAIDMNNDGYTDLVFSSNGQMVIRYAQ